MSLYRRKYRVESTRLKGWDYSGPGWYFVTICTRDRFCWLGSVQDGDVVLSPQGRIVAEEWQRTPIVRANTTLDVWVIMPNHLHGIVVINAAAGGMPGAADARRAEAGLKPGSLGAIVGQLKSISKKRIQAAGYGEFAWQPRFYEHIIRNQDALAEIREYIVNNPRQWEIDTLNPERQSQ